MLPCRNYILTDQVFNFLLSQLSLEPAHSPNSPFSLLSLSTCYLAAALSAPLTPLSHSIR